MTRLWWVVAVALLLASCSVNQPPAADGDPNEQEPSVIAAQVVASENASFVLDDDGSAWSWGLNDNGQLATGDVNAATRPRSVQRPTGRTFDSLAFGALHGLAVDDQGSLWSWGLNTAYALGSSDVAFNANVSTPVAVDAPTGASFVLAAAGAAHSLALDDAGAAWSWGENAAGQLGVGTEGPGTRGQLPAAVTMPTGVQFRTLAAGPGHSLAVDTTGGVWAWGSNGSGELGVGADTVNSNTPVRVTFDTGVEIVAIDAEGLFNVALDADGVIWTWGANGNGQLGIGSLVNAATPVRVAMPNGVTFTTVAAGSRHVVALDDDGALWAWGDNFDGQLGIGDAAGGPVAVPVRTVSPEGVRFVSVAAANAHSLAIDEDGNVYAWGDGSQGQLGSGSGTPLLVPAFIGWSLER